MDRAPLEQIRTFNRTVAQRIGALTDGFLGRGRPMGESRVLWEIGSDGAEIRVLRARLGLDSGYMSRVLKSLERQRLVTLSSSPADARVRFARLTRAGSAERVELDRLSNEVAWSFVQPLNEGQRQRLVTAMTEVERLLRQQRLSGSTGRAGQRPVHRHVEGAQGVRAGHRPVAARGEPCTRPQQISKDILARGPLRAEERDGQLVQLRLMRGP